jgi:hypothetical protein
MSAVIQDTLQIVITVSADATGGVEYIVPRNLTVVGVDVIATATDAGGTLTVSSANGNITNALACAAANTAARATTITTANASFVAGAVITVTANQAATRGVVIVSCLATPAATLAEN